MSPLVQQKITKDIVTRRFGQDNEIYAVAKRIFSKETFVSTASLQRKLQIPYFRARYVLDRMIQDGYCVEQIGAYPCNIIKISRIN